MAHLTSLPTSGAEWPIEAVPFCHLLALAAALAALTVPQKPPGTPSLTPPQHPGNTAALLPSRTHSHLSAEPFLLKPPPRGAFPWSLVLSPFLWHTVTSAVRQPHVTHVADQGDDRRALPGLTCGPCPKSQGHWCLGCSPYPPALPPLCICRLPARVAMASAGPLSLHHMPTALSSPAPAYTAARERARTATPPCASPLRLPHPQVKVGRRRLCTAACTPPPSQSAHFFC